MAWVKQFLEFKLEEILRGKYGEEKGDCFFADYTSARRSLDEDILREIKIIVPELTDHGVDHVINVLSNISKLLGDEIALLSAMEVYALCVSALFHDVGNIKGREFHNQKISEVYDYVRGAHPRFRPEKRVVLKIAEAHCGKTREGSFDTLKPLADMYLNEEGIRARDLASILRFADELAEGRQRTSAYMLSRHGYTEESLIHHKYAELAKVTIDRGNGRIALDYDVEFELKDGELIVYDGMNLPQMLMYIYRRIVKLDQERKYTKHYCPLLSTFTETSITLNYWLCNTQLDLDLRPIVLSDLVIPGEATKNIVDAYPDYKIEMLVDKIMPIAARGA